MRNRSQITFILGLVAVAVTGVLAIGIFERPSPPVPRAKQLQVVATLFPLYDFARIVGGSKVDVTFLLPPGVDPHSFEPTPKDVVAINRADVFVYTGPFMEVWAANVLKGVDNPHLLVVDASVGIKLIPAVFHDSDEPVGSMDPHIWLDFGNDRTIVNAIASAFATKDPADRAYYERNATDYNRQLVNLDQEYRSALSHCQIREIIYGGHYAFGYLAHRYRLKYLAAQGVSPDTEPTAGDLAALVNQIRNDRIKYVFYEELASPKIAETLSEETRARLLPLTPAADISRKDLARGTSYLSLMKNNLANLKTGLGCR